MQADILGVFEDVFGGFLQLGRQLGEGVDEFANRIRIVLWHGINETNESSFRDTESFVALREGMG